MQPKTTIDGATRLFFIIGDPIVQVKSPPVFTSLFIERGVNAVMLPVHVLPPDIRELGPVLRSIQNLDGILVTAPYKGVLSAIAETLGPTAQCMGAINALRRSPDGGWHGDLFDGAGFLAGAIQKGLDPKDRKVLLYGAGGAGSAIAFELARHGVNSIRLIDSDRAKATRLVQLIRQALPSFDIEIQAGDAGSMDMIINATTVGVGGSRGLPGEIPPLHPGIVVGEVNVTADGTDLIKLAKQAGCGWVDGTAMHRGQVESLLDFFFCTQQ